MKNSIAERIADFLKPFLNLSMLDLIAISKESQVVYLEKKSAFNVNDQPHSSFILLKMER
jgi:CBS domain-containing protein